MSEPGRSIDRYIDASPYMLDLMAGLPGGTDPLVIHHGDASPEGLRELVADARVILNGHTFMDAALLRAAPGLRSIVFLGSGASSYIDLAAAGRLGIVVRAVPGYGDRAVAEHAFALLLAAARDVARMDRDLRAGLWDAREGIELRGRVLGIVGLAGIGRETASIAAAFGMEVIAWNRSAVAPPAGVTLCGLDELLARSDAVSLHLGLTPETRHFLDAARLSAMKPGAILVNTARAGLVDTLALIEALRSGRLRHAAIDVFDEEPLPPGDPLTSLPNVTLTTHAAYKTRQASIALVSRALDAVRADIAALDAGRPLT